jgi:hypothetical protein
VLEKALMDAVANTSESVAEGPRTALRLDEPVTDTRPVFPEMEKGAAVLESPPHKYPSEAVPHRAWLARWKSSAAMAPPEGSVVDVVVVADGTVVEVDDVEVDEVGLVVVVGGGAPDWIASASLPANSSLNQIRCCESTFRPSWGCPPLGLL